MPTIHWLGAGLSSAPGIVRLAKSGTPLCLWNRTLDKADAVLACLPTPPPTRQLDFTALAAALDKGDILVSMLPGEFHCEVAHLALAHSAHFVSSSYISPQMQDLNTHALRSGLCLVNEVGLDPGLDHLMAHQLVSAYRDSSVYDPALSLRFRSYCGGFPKQANDFRYKFSWSPLGVLRALKSPARCIQGGAEQLTERPWHAISEYNARFPDGAEAFEAYPNRDSLPFMTDYQFDPAWPIEEFVRGTLRLPGWSEAWADLFAEIEELEGPGSEARMRAISDDLWQRYRYQQDEPDRVVLCVELEASAGNQRKFHQGYTLDSSGTEHGSAMARLVSHTVSLAVEAVAAAEVPAGVTAAPSNPQVIDQWFSKLASLGDTIECHDYLSAST